MHTPHRVPEAVVSQPPQFSREVKERLLEAIGRFSQCRLLIVGDVMLDTFIWGQVRRISPEAPVPVVEVTEETRCLGGMANVVHNVAALGGRPVIAGVIGNDPSGRELVRMLRKASVPTDGLIVEDGRPTTEKTRIVAQNQQVVRFDRESTRPLQADTVSRMQDWIRERVSGVRAVVVSDYAKGVVTPEIMDVVRAAVSQDRLPIFVDPKIQHREMYRGVTLITPNHHEASRMADMEMPDEASLGEAGRRLLSLLDCETVLITRGKDGMSLFDRSRAVVHIPTVARRVYDVTGAGDTVIASVALGMVAGLKAAEAALLANLAAGIVVGEVGTAAVDADRLRRALQDVC